MKDKEAIAKAWLNRSFEKYQYLKYLGEHLEVLETSINKCVSNYEANETKGGSALNPQESKLLSYSTLEQLISEKKLELMKEDDVTLATINKLTSGKERAILTYRHIHRMSWKKIEAKVNYSHSGIMNIYSDALYNIYEYLPTDEKSGQ